jgi:hypothetical protein
MTSSQNGSSPSSFTSCKSWRELLILSSDLFVAGLRSSKSQKGPVDLGKFGPSINFIAVAWNTFSLSSLPVRYTSQLQQYAPGRFSLTWGNMNYSCVVLRIVFLFAKALYAVWGRKVYRGPVREVMVG